MAIRASVIAASLLAGCADRADQAYEPLLSLACDKTVVLLGEDADHGGGTSQAFKSALVTDLVQQCGFDTIAVEASVYEFAELTRRAAQGEALGEEDVVAALGRLWGDNAEVAPLVSVIASGLDSGDVRVVGLDYQMGGLGQDYANERLGYAVFALVPEEQRARCVGYIDDLAWGRAVDLRAFNACLAAGRGNSRHGHMALEARALRLFAERLSLPREQQSAHRRRAMVELYGRQVGTGKTAVWASDTHTHRGGPAHDNLGSALGARHGSDALSVGFGARGGTVRSVSSEVKPWPDREPRKIDVVLGGATAVLVTNLERKPFATGSDADAAVRDGGRTFDAVVVFREMRPATKMPRP